MRSPLPILLVLGCVPLLLAACDSGNDPVVSPIPTGTWRYETPLAEGETLVRHLHLAYDTAKIFDTIYAAGRTVDSVHHVVMELKQMPEGYFRALERHRNSDSTTFTLLRYWFFFRDNGELRHYRGFRFFGANPGLIGVWETAPADAEQMGYSMTWKFDEKKLTLHHVKEDDTTLFAGSYDLQGRILIPGPTLNLPLEPRRIEVLPGFALYLTSEAPERYQPAPEG